MDHLVLASSRLQAEALDRIRSCLAGLAGRLAVLEANLRSSTQNPSGAALAEADQARLAGWAEDRALPLADALASALDRLPAAGARLCLRRPRRRGPAGAGYPRDPARDPPRHRLRGPGGPGARAGLVLAANHNPLLAQLEQRAPGRYRAEYLQSGPDLWRLGMVRQ
jgi:hypothetical protein